MRKNNLFLERFCGALLLNLCFFVTTLFAQQSSPTPGQTDSAAVQHQVDTAADSQAQAADETPPVPTPLLIGPSDELEITVFGAPDLSTHARVENDGNIVLPLVGLVSVGGDSSNQAARKIEDSLRRASLVKNPRVSVYVKSYSSSGISVAGQVNKPGFYPALGPHRLFDILQAAGGPSQKAANSVTISHRDDPDHPMTLTFSKDPGELARNNIELQPGDTVVVPEAGIVYVLGEITRPGGYVMNSSGGVTILQVVAAAGGPTRLASYGGVKIIRRTPSGLHEVPVPLKPLLQAKVADQPVQAGDILYVPSSRAKSALAASSSLINTLGQTAIYRLP